MKRRLILVAVAALAPAVAILAYNEFAARRLVAQQVGVEALEANRQASSEIERIFEGVRALLIATSAIPAVRTAEADPEACKDSLASVVTAAPWIRTILVINPAGRLVCDTLGTSSTNNFADRTYFQRALQGDDFFVGEYTDSRLSSSPILPVSIPLRDRNGAITGVLSTAIRLDWFNERMRERGIGAGNALTVADRDGVIVARYPNSAQFVGTRIPDAFRWLVHAEDRGTLEVVSQDGTTRMLGYSPSSKSPFGLYISVGLSKDAAFAELNRQTLVGILSIILGILIALLAAWFTGGLIRKPLNLISRVMNDWKRGVAGSRTRLKAEAGDVEAVGEDLDQLLNELERRQLATAKAEEQRDLLMRELAHRVKNTLALVQAIASQTFGRENPANGQAFTERLVALSGAYDVLLGDQFQGGAIEEIVRAALRPHLANEGRVAVAGPQVQLSPQTALALSLVVHELATNAIKYGALSNDTGSIDIRWGLDNGFVDLTWKETGGPPVIEPGSTGFGSKLIKRAFGAEAAAVVQVDYFPGGIVCQTTFKPGVEEETSDLVQ